MITPGEIEAWRKQHGLTKKELAESMGITYPFLVNILNGKRELSATTAVKFELLRCEEQKRSIDEIRAFAVRLTPHEYSQLAAVAGVDNLSAEEAEKAVRSLLQKTWDELANKVPHVVQEVPDYGKGMEPFA